MQLRLYLLKAQTATTFIADRVSNYGDKSKMMPIRNMAFILPSLIFVALGCVDNRIEAQICYEGIVIGKFRSWGGGIAVSMEESTFSTHRWRGFENVIEALNISQDVYEPGEKIFFTGRLATKKEQVFAMSADGDESDKPVVYIDLVSTINCPTYD
jgi:hypothetical protein